MTRSQSILIVGAGAFGCAAAVELRYRGAEVTLVDPGPIPHPQASSTDTSKAARLDYGSDRFYVELADEALAGWRDWNREWGQTLFHEVGIVLLTPGKMTPGGFEAESYSTLKRGGVPLERLDAGRLVARFPAWSGAPYVDGYYNPRGGWVESGAAVARLADAARRAGVVVRDGERLQRLHEQDTKVTGIVLESGEVLRGDIVLVAAGAWTPMLLPHLSPLMWPVGQPVAYFRPQDPTPFEARHFPVWCADIARTGWYGFPITADGELKVANHGPGRRIAAGEPLVVTQAEAQRTVEFCRTAFPQIDTGPAQRTRLCLYCDTFDGDFLLDHDPDRPGLVVAAGGSGHGFKFAPLLGCLIADVVERRPNPAAERFAWRTPGEHATEQARHDVQSGVE